MIDSEPLVFARQQFLMCRMVEAQRPLSLARETMLLTTYSLTTSAGWSDRLGEVVRGSENPFEVKSAGSSTAYTVCLTCVAS